MLSLQDIEGKNKWLKHGKEIKNPYLINDYLNYLLVIVTQIKAIFINIPGNATATIGNVLKVNAHENPVSLYWEYN